jgi:hypothetical protein
MEDGLPALEDYSMRRILAAIAEEIEDDVEAIAEILGRSRLVLANQHDSHMPPQGEIRALLSPLQAVAEASSSNEQLAGTADAVLIVGEDASLVDGSHTGSAAYNLLERLQAVPPTRRMRSEIPPSVTSRPGTGVVRHNSSPADIQEIAGQESATSEPANIPSPSRRNLPTSLGTYQSPYDPSQFTSAAMSGTYLSTVGDAMFESDPSVPFQARLDSLNREHVAPSARSPARPPTLRSRIRSLLPRMELQNLFWLQGPSPPQISAESQLREILERQQASRRTRSGREEAFEEPHMYG